MNITIIDESTYLPNFAIERLQNLGELIRYTDRPSRNEAIERLKEADIAIVEWTSIDRDMLQQTDRLKYIVVALTGYSFVDVDTAKARGILVSNIPSYARQSVAEHAFGLLLAANRKLPLSNQEAKSGKRDHFAPFLGQELYGKTLGVLGLGSIGSWVARIGQGFGMKVIGTNRTSRNLPGVEEVDLDVLLSQSDALIVCVSKNESSKGMLSKERLALMKQNAILVSIVSGICDEDALAGMLNEGRISGVALDIPSKGSPLEKVDQAVLTTGIAWYTQASLDRLVTTVVENVEMFLAGRPRNVVNA